MSPFVMDTESDPNSPDSLLITGSDKEEETYLKGKRGTKRREKNRDAARKSRKKQTQRADELHEELQCVEQTNLALEKEIATLKRELRLYATALERHKPLCRLRTSSSSPTARLAASPSPSPAAALLPMDLQCCSSPASPPLQTSCSSFAGPPSHSTSLTFPTVECVQSAHLSSSPRALTSTTSNSSPTSSTETFSSSASFCLSPHSLFAPVSASLVSNLVPSAFLTTTPLPHSDHRSSSASANAVNAVLRSSSHVSPSVPHSDTLHAFLLKQVSFPTSSFHSTSTVLPPYSPITPSIAEKATLAPHGCSMNTSELHPGRSGCTPTNSSSPCTLLPTFHQDSALQSLSVSPQTNPDPFSALDFALKSSYNQQNAPNPLSLLSLLTVPSPIDIPQNTSSSSTGPPCQPSSSLLPLTDNAKDVSLSELLESNDWILSGTCNQ
ncbi:hypothetical protein LDENG_00027640 [Lucifuga dentata]|nr:hypothetical protein LDENG_00027640 [Lucifuga dentata]